jgi:hypothetical protein
MASLASANSIEYMKQNLKPIQVKSGCLLEGLVGSFPYLGPLFKGMKRGDETNHSHLLLRRVGYFKREGAIGANPNQLANPQ